MATQTETDIVAIRSRSSVNPIVDRLNSLLDSKGLTLIAIVDHSGEAKNVGIEIKPTKPLFLGRPKAGIPVMPGAHRCNR